MNRQSENKEKRCLAFDGAFLRISIGKSCSLDGGKKSTVHRLKVK